MKRMTVVAGLCLLFCLSPAASAYAADTTTTAATSPTALVHVNLPSAGISVGYPSTWTPIKGLPKSVLTKAAKLNPRFGDVLKQVPTSAKLYVIDLTNPQFSDNVTVITDGSGGFPASMSDFRQGVAGQYQAIGATLVDTTTMKVGGRTGYEAVAQLPVKVNATTTVMASSVAVLIPKGDGGTLVTITTTDDDAGHALAKRIATSIKMLN